MESVMTTLSWTISFSGNDETHIPYWCCHHQRGETHQSSESLRVVTFVPWSCSEQGGNRCITPPDPSRMKNKNQDISGFWALHVIHITWSCDRLNKRTLQHLPDVFIHFAESHEREDDHKRQNMVSLAHHKGQKGWAEILVCHAKIFVSLFNR